MRRFVLALFSFSLALSAFGGCTLVETSFGAPCATDVDCAAALTCRSGVCIDRAAGEGEGVAAGEGEGANASEGEGANAGEGEGANAGEGEGVNAGEGEGANAGEGEGEGATVRPPIAISDVIVVHAPLPGQTSREVTTTLTADELDAATVTFELDAQPPSGITVALDSSGAISVTVDDTAQSTTLPFHAVAGDVIGPRATLAIEVIVDADHTTLWTGLGSTSSFTDPGNWAGGILSETTDIPFIPSDAPQFPQSTGADVTLRGAIIETGASIALGARSLILRSNGSGFGIIGGGVDSTNTTEGVIADDVVIEGRFPSVHVENSNSAPTAVSHAVIMQSLLTDAELRLNGDLSVMPGDFFGDGGGTITDIAPGHRMFLKRNGTFFGGASFVSGGELRVQGDLRGGFSSPLGHNCFIDGDNARTITLNGSAGELTFDGRGVSTASSATTLQVLDQLVVKNGATLSNDGSIETDGLFQLDAGGTATGTGTMVFTAAATSSGTYSVTTTELRGHDTSFPNISFDDVIVTGTVQLPADTGIFGTLTVAGIGGLDLNGKQAIVNGDVDDESELVLDNGSVLIGFGDVTLRDASAVSQWAAGEIVLDSAGSARLELGGGPVTWGTGSFLFLSNAPSLTIENDDFASCDETSGAHCTLANFGVSTNSTARISTPLFVSGQLVISGDVALTSSGYLSAAAVNVNASQLHIGTIAHASPAAPCAAGQICYTTTCDASGSAGTVNCAP